MKRLLRVCLTLALFFALLPGAGAEEGFRFTRENFPKLDGSRLGTDLHREGL